jgi:hypothetical protein
MDTCAAMGEPGMKLSVQVIVHPDDTNDAPTAREAFNIDRDDLSPDTLGLAARRGPDDLLAAVQDTLVDQQGPARGRDPDSLPALREATAHGYARTILARSLFGALRLHSPRWWHCDCREQPTRTFPPLAAPLPERTTPELAYQQARFAGLVSYGLTAKLLGELPPLGRPLHPAVVRGQTQAVASGWRVSSARRSPVPRPRPRHQRRDLRLRPVGHSRTCGG